ncbi:Ca-activated chloride channel family protein [Desulfuromusa kysingii]|uniref:Ca-activated chloride channel family protein n=1 Tax=Desulfuromusa kysingii TaxID=37625 RepID=A0A1H3ZHV1_9BACT|nr:VWA domain-containing protein [Desulfuromusa kysingii]SEA23260.1 Ca-activated chloride channel family protein [Desulfuromusa kysingii]
MIHFAWPWAFALLPLPYLIYRLAPPALAAEEAALWVPQLAPFSVAQHQHEQRKHSRFELFLALFCWLLLVIACARPQWLGEPLELPVSGRDLQLAVDLSGSMQTEDFDLHGSQVDRLTALKAVAEPFIEARVGDRIGLILFGEQAYVQAPLSFDRETIKSLLNEAAIGLAGDRTAIGDAIGLALKRATADEAKHQVLILLTDGVNNAGQLSPLKAAELAAQQGLKIYTIGLGADTMKVRSFIFSQTINPSRDLDEKTLQAIAETTGGLYFRAHDSAELKKIYSLLDQLEPVEREQEVYRPITALFPWPLGAALCGVLLLAGLQLLPTLRRSR